MKHCKHIYLLILSVMALSCKEEPLLMNYVSFSVQATDASGTKTEMEEHIIGFSKNEQLYVCCEGINAAILSNANSVTPNSFSGIMYKKHLAAKDCNWYALYPASSFRDDGNNINTELATLQDAPFDSNSNMMFSDVTVADYDENSMPELSFSMNQLFGILEVSITNSSDTFKDEHLSSIQISSSLPLSGSCSFDIHQTNPVPVFSEYGSTKVISKYKSSPLLGKGLKYTSYLFVNPIDIPDFKIVVKTDKHVFTKESSTVIHARQGKIISFSESSPLDISSFDVTEPGLATKKIACWGDSFTHSGYSSYADELGELLGESWEMFNGGCSGSKVHETVARQGGIAVVTDASFVMRSDTKSFTTNAFLRTKNDSCEDGYFGIRSFSNPLINPCEICGVLCNVSSSGESGQATIKRLEPGEEIEIPAHSVVKTFAARNLEDVDVTVLYLRANGGWDPIGTDSGDEHYFDNLINYYHYALSHLDNPNDYIILGIHSNLTTDYYVQNWLKRLRKEFDPARVINMRDDVAGRGIELLLRTGAFVNEEMIPASEKERINNGLWPYTFWHSQTDHHPSAYGAKAMAIIVYEKLEELGYFD